MRVRWRVKPALPVSCQSFTGPRLSPGYHMHYIFLTKTIRLPFISCEQFSVCSCRNSMFSVIKMKIVYYLICLCVLVSLNVCYITDIDL